MTTREGGRQSASTVCHQLQGYFKDATAGQGLAKVYLTTKVENGGGLAAVFGPQAAPVLAFLVTPNGISHHPNAFNLRLQQIARRHEFRRRARKTDPFRRTAGNDVARLQRLA